MIHLQPYQPEDINGLIHFLSAYPWPFHGGATRSLKEEQAAVQRSAKKGYYEKTEDAESFWIAGREGQRIGFARLFDLEDDTPLFDLRIAPEERGKSVGYQALNALCKHVFEVHQKPRFEGHTRIDNIAMRRVFLKCGFLKEAHHREAWPDEATGKNYDSVGYGILKSDWINKKHTPFTWNDDPAVTPEWE